MPPVDPSIASSVLLSAAMGGLLGLAPGCGSSDAGSGSHAGGTDVASGAGAQAPDAAAILATDAGASIAAGTSVGGGPTTEPTTATNGDTPSPRTECALGVYPTPQVLASAVDATMTAAKFTAECAARKGIFETQPNCGGSNSCRGMSYDNDTQTLRDHSCRATNSCAGFSCVVCD